MPEQNELKRSLPQLQEDIFRRLIRLTTMIRQWGSLMSYGQEDPLTVSQAIILHWIRVDSPYPSTIARRLGVTPTAITGQITRLERLGYITRDIDPTDRRRIILKLTEKGRQRSELAEEQFIQFISPSSTDWRAEDIEQIHRGLELLENLLQQVNEDLVLRRPAQDASFLDDGVEEALVDEASPAR